MPRIKNILFITLFVLTLPTCASDDNKKIHILNSTNIPLKCSYILDNQLVVKEIKRDDLELVDTNVIEIKIWQRNVETINIKLSDYQLKNFILVVTAKLAYTLYSPDIKEDEDLPKDPVAIIRNKTPEKIHYEFVLDDGLNCLKSFVPEAFQLSINKSFLSLKFWTMGKQPCIVNKDDLGEFTTIIHAYHYFDVKVLNI